MNWQKIGEELQEIEVDGLAEPHNIVEYARSHPESEIYASFDRRGLWDDKAAAEAGRLHHAHWIMRCYVEIVETPDGKKVPTRAYVSLKGDRKNGLGYRPLNAVLASEELRRQLVRDAKRDWQIYRRRYRVLEELATAFNAMDQAIESASTAIEPTEPQPQPDP